MYEPSRCLMSFYIAGVQFWNAALVINQMRVGDELEIVPETDNPHDSSAIALRYKGEKLGFVPQQMNEEISLLCFYGHGNILEARVQQVDTTAAPWEQIRVGIYIKDAR